MAAKAQQRGLPPRATTIAIATAFQESKIHNIDYGDRDSIGLFQQRPSQGWGTVEQIMAPALLDRKVLRGACQGRRLRFHGDQRRRASRATLWLPHAYAQHEDYARALASALRGYSPAKFTCQINPRGAGSIKRITADVAQAFGDLPVTRDGDVAGTR
ncbi:hypothetical protein [Aeromicrobium sp. UC242_57]|uniref:hypothetical protein n=1 Tax=Aeromicrobium sp. UC242_57 TaxID=3374624 RepID=UPI00379FBD59